MQEIWIDIRGYEGKYQISNLGQVKSLKNKIILKNAIISKRKGKDGYKVVNLQGKIFYIHRLVANAFIPNKNNLPQVNHIDGNKLNNRIDNLEWVTASQNIKHAYKVNLMFPHQPNNNGFKRNKIVQQIDKRSNQVLKEWASVKEAAETLNIGRTCISGCCRNKQKTAGGYIWRYK